MQIFLVPLVVVVVGKFFAIFTINHTDFSAPLEHHLTARGYGKFFLCPEEKAYLWEDLQCAHSE